MKTCTHRYTFCDCPEPLGWRILGWLASYVFPWLLIGALLFVAGLAAVVALRAA